VSVPTLADSFRHLACLAEVRGDPGARTLRAVQTHLDRLTPAALSALIEAARAPSKPDLPDMDRPAADRVREAVTLGAEPLIRAARARVPLLHRLLLERNAITHDEAATLARDHGVVTLGDLQAFLAEPRSSRLPTVMHARLKSAASALAAELRPVPLGRACEVLGACLDATVRLAGVDAGMIAGDARRFEPLVDHLVLAARSPHPSATVDAVTASRPVDDVLHRTARRALVSVRGTEVDIRVAAPDEFGTMVFAATGAPGHVAHMRRRRSGLDLCAREEDVYARAGLPWIPPELRNDSGEIEAALAGRLPRLVERTDIRGDLHMHSTYSDGQDTVEAMLRAAAALGYEYAAITDHSENAAASRTVMPDQLARQRDEIERLRPLFPSMEILHGLEVDILQDGRLDCADAILERLDIVLASLHDHSGQGPEALTRRCLRAIHHPLVNVITHPSNQIVGRRPGYSMDFEAIYAAAAGTGTALEIDGAPSHLDLDGAHARAAVAAGVTVTIDSDCHRASGLERQMTFGIGTARRGWVEARNVLNTRPMHEVKAFIRAKRVPVG